MQETVAKAWEANRMHHHHFFFTFLLRGSPYKRELQCAILIELQIGALPSAAAQKKITWCEALSSSPFFKVARRAKIKVSSKSVILTTSTDIRFSFALWSLIFYGLIKLLHVFGQMKVMTSTNLNNSTLGNYSGIILWSVDPKVEESASHPTLLPCLSKGGAARSM